MFHRCLEGFEVTDMTVTIVGGGLNVDKWVLPGDGRRTLGLNLRGYGTVIGANICEEVVSCLLRTSCSPSWWCCACNAPLEVCSV